MKNIKILFILIFLASMVAKAQNDKRFEEIQNSKQYVWGYGESKDYDNANKLALEDLVGKISVHVESYFENSVQQKNNQINDYVKSVINTYSNTTLTNAREQMFQKKGVYHILRYIKAQNIQTLFKDREEKLRNYIVLGDHARKQDRIGDALRYYYWAYALDLSDPYHAQLKINKDSTSMLIDLFLSDRINALLQKINFAVSNEYKSVKDNKTTVFVNCTYDGKKVEDLDYRFNAGGSISPLHSVSSGQSEIDLFGADQTALESLNLQIEYKYLSKSFQDKELTSVLNTVNVPFFDESVKKIYLHTPTETYKAKKVIDPSYETLNKIAGDKNFYRKAIKHLLILIADTNYSEAKKDFTPTGQDMFKKLIQYGKVSILPLKDTLKIIQLNNEVMVRSIPMSFYFPNSHRQFTENVVFTFNEDRMIDDISFAISDNTIYDITSHSKNFGSVRDKYTLIKFLENYKTAYCLKRLNYINSIFSDNALIIVGTVLKRSQPIDGMYQNLGSEAVKYQRFTKKEYIERLKSVFNSNEFINIDFDETSVKKVNGDRKIYGIQIAQHYYSTDYSDFGYLFLMIDLKDSLKPMIYVRTWQPKKNPDGSIYGLGDFSMN
ncbi:MAG: LPP20 family lipoprotein [Bacteroidales bacterium]|nr:LPP20 family lipoprotein [Bacteroidales bacterium]